MEFWPGNQGLSPLYPAFTLPGRNCTQIYHDRHQAARNPLYYRERQEQRREPSYWTLPGSRVASQEYATWMEPEPAGLSSSHFPFTLNRHPQHHVGAYQPLDARDREWTQRASREYEREIPREGWPRRWGTCDPARYSREVSTKRNDSSYQELEAWAARYSHSLQRRRRIEAELRGASQGPAESSRAPERGVSGGTTTLQPGIQAGFCDGAGRHQARPLPAALADSGHPLREQTCSQRRIFSQPPGYIAPPSYDTPQKSAPVSPRGDTSWDQEGKKQTCWSQPIAKKQDMAIDGGQMRKTGGFTKPDANQHHFCPQYSKPGADSLPGIGYVPRPRVESKEPLSLSPILPTLQNKAEEPSSKIIEGRKFRLNKKAGGVTIFCLVSRMADATAVPAQPVCAPQANLKDTEGGGAPEGLCEQNFGRTHKLADEVDHRGPESQSEASNTGDSQAHGEAGTGSGTEKPETDVVEEEEAKERAKDAESPAGMQSGKSAWVRYPLWREPSFPVRSEHMSSPTALEAEGGEGEPGVLCNRSASAEVQCEVRPEEAEGEAEGAGGLPGADATRVVVKMEQIPPPKKEHVHYLDATPHLEECVQPNQGENTDQNTKPEPLNTEKPEQEPDWDILDRAEPEPRTISDPCRSSAGLHRETLAVRAERILGIPLKESVAERPPEDAASLKTKADQAFAAKVSDEDGWEEDKTEQERSQNQMELEQSAVLPETVEAKEQVDDEDGQESTGPQEDGSTLAHPETHIEASGESDDGETKADSDENAYERSERESSSVEDGSSSPLLGPSTGFRPPSSQGGQSPDVLPPRVPSTSNPASVSENPGSECTDLDPMAPVTAPANGASAPPPSQRLASLPSPPSPSPQDPQSTTSLDSENQSQPGSSVLDLDEDDETSHPTNTEVSEEFEDISNDETEKVASQPQKKVREQVEAKGGREMNLDNEQQAEQDEVLVDSGVQETETSAEVSQALFQDEDEVYTAEGPGSAGTEEELTQVLEESNAKHGCLQPAGTNTNGMEPPNEAQTEEKTSCENNNLLIQSQEVTLSQLCDSGGASVIQETSEEQLEGAAGSLQRQETGKENSSESHTDTENQLELGPSSSAPASPAGSELLLTSEPPAPSQVPPVSGTGAVPLVKMDLETAVTTETDISPLHLVSRKESEKLSSSSDSPPGRPMSSSPPLLLEGNQSDAFDSTLSEEPQYPKSLWDAVNRIRKHTAPDSENEEEELGEVWDPENIGEDSGRPHGAQDTVTETKEVLVDESLKEANVKQTQQGADGLEEGPPVPGSPSSGEVLTDKEEDNKDTSPEIGTEFRTLKEREIHTAAEEQSCAAEDEDEDQGHQ